MATSFFGLYVQRDALQLAQKALDITGHNITNIKTEGYSRQRLDVCSVANTKGTLGYNTSITLAGKGADALGVTQIRDKLLDNKVRKYSAELCDTGAKTSILADIEDILDDVENETTGLSAIFGNWKATFQSFSATGADRQDLANISMNSAQSVLNVLKNFETRIKDVEKATENDIENTNTRINAILKEMASLNKQIEDGYVQMNDVNATPGGYKAEIEYGPLELKDQFNALCDELSQYINITVTEQPTGSYKVEFADNTLVYKDSYAKTDIKFRSDYEDVVKGADGTEIKAAYLEYSPEYNEDGEKVQQPAARGTELFFENGDASGVFADGNGGYINEDGEAVQVYILGESKFYNADGDEIENIATINDGAVVYDENGNEISVNGNFDAECISYTFSELYVSSANTEKEWSKTQRELTPELEEAGLGEMITKFNALLESNDVEQAYRYEEELMAAAAGKGVEYNPVFLEHMADKNAAPAYAISISNETATLSAGSLKGLFDMYNGEGCYSGIDGNSYKGVKYYQETIRSMGITIVDRFNSIYEQYNKDNPDDPFYMFSFDGAFNIGNMELADEWKDNPLRCIHPQGTEEGDYNYDELDNKWINDILAAFESKNDFGTEPLEYTFEEFISYYGNTIGSQLEYELSDFDATTTMLESVSSAREEVMGVSMDEEGVNMMNYQKWYNAISRMITALDQCLEKLINGTGVVGL